MKRYLVNVIASWSQFWNAFWGGNRDQSFSSRSYEAFITGRTWGRFAVLFVNLLFLDPLHCPSAYHSDDERTYT